MSIEETIEMMDDMLDKAKAVPLTGGKCLVDVDKLHEMLNEIRLNMPTEIKQARNLVNDRKTIISDAKTEADQIIRRAEEKAKQMVSQQEITRQAQAKSNEIMTNTQQKSKELRVTTNEYVDNMLAHVEELLSSDVQDVKKARAALKGGKN